MDNLEDRAREPMDKPLEDKARAIYKPLNDSLPEGLGETRTRKVEWKPTYEPIAAQCSTYGPNR